MRLTARKAVEISREAWMELAETGADTKEGLAVWEKYGAFQNDCPLCEYDRRHNDDCQTCPLWEQWEGEGACEDDETPYDDWKNAKGPRGRKAAAWRMVALFDKWLEKHKKGGSR